MIKLVVDDEPITCAHRRSRERHGWPTTVVARVSLNMLRSRQSRREDPVDLHVPDPVISLKKPAHPEQQAVGLP